MDRKKYMDASEVKQLRDSMEGRALLDLKAGRVRGPLAWVVVDTALSTGLRVNELAKLQCADFNARRRSLLVWRTKKKEPVR